MYSYRQIAESLMHQLQLEERTRVREAYRWQLMFSRFSAIIHVDPRKEYEAKHLPDAVRLSRIMDLSTDRM